MKRITGLLLSAGALALGACSGGDGGNNVAANEAAENANSMTNDPNNPFGAAEMQMHERMTAATGANASETWVRKLIEHHRGGIAMSDILIQQGGGQRFLEMARASADMQRRDIAELERMLAGGVTGGNGPANPFGPVETRMHDQMMAAAMGTNAADTWARKMITHHQGAIDMSQILIDQGGDPEVVAAARRTIEMQRREIGELERLLGGGAASQPAEGNTTAAAPAAPAPAARRPNAAPKAAPAPRREQPKQATPRPVPTPEPSPPPKAECLPEHRAAGHC